MCSESMNRFRKCSSRLRLHALLAALFVRLPVSLLGLAIAASALQASCGGSTDHAGSSDDHVGAGPVVVDAGAYHDAPSEDSSDDRADGMSYGDGYSP
jgi:hypothetical protein